MIAHNTEADSDPRIDPREPTDAWPGSAEKIEVLRARVARGERLWHRQDAGMHGLRDDSPWGDWFERPKPTPRPPRPVIQSPVPPLRPIAVAPVKVPPKSFAPSPQPTRKPMPMPQETPAIKPSTADELLKAVDLLVDRPENVVKAIDLKMDEHRQSIAKLTRLRNVMTELAKA